MLRTAVIAALLLASAPAAAEEEGLDWAGVPILNFDSDAGVGLGVLGSLYWMEPEIEPYRRSLTLQIFVSTELVQAHELQWDLLRVADTPLRITGKAGYYATITRNFCGYGNEVTCDPDVAEQAAMDAGLSPGSDEFDAFTRHYYQRRFVNPWGTVIARWPFDRRWSAFGGWRLSYLLPGTFSDRDHYQGSLYDELVEAGEVPGGGDEQGLVSVPQVGVVYDSRDNEPAPNRGLWFEASVRGAALPTGSSWSFAGANTTTRLYLPIGGRLVAATRLVADVLVGDPPTEELAQMGGTELYEAFGGKNIGRGIRSHRYLGRIKLLGQQELRWTALRWKDKAITLNGFVDAGHLALDWDEFGGDPGRVLWSAGGGVRVAWTPNFIVRLDVGASPYEQEDPQFYVYIGHVY